METSDDVRDILMDVAALENRIRGDLRIRTYDLPVKVNDGFGLLRHWLVP